MTTSARWALREATGAEHARLDAAFARFALSDAGDYAAFLQAHARVLHVLEAAVAESGAAWQGWSPRAARLDEDLRELGITPGRTAAAVERVSPAQAWGVQYVLEGSRLGGRLLAERVAPGAPRRYLADAQPPGAWGRFQQALEQGVTGAGALEEAQAGARMAFARFQSAADSA